MVRELCAKEKEAVCGIRTRGRLGNEVNLFTRRRSGRDETTLESMLGCLLARVKRSGTVCASTLWQPLPAIID